jgi:hypothetical protein
MFITTCSLGCGNGSNVAQVSCSIINVAVDREIDVFFSDAIDPASVNSTTFQLIDVTTGQAPAGTRFVDASDPTKMVFRPAITFDNQGNVTFGFTPQTTYLITIAGTLHNDSGPFIRSVGGTSNSSRMQCQIHTTNQVDDLVPGPPTASVFVSLATGQPPPNDHIDNQPAQGAVNVWHNSTVRISFNDVMNPASLINPNTHQATLITILVDSDGNPNTTQDQVTLFGSYALSVDLQHLTTDLVFTPANGMPSAGNQTPPRFIVVNIPPGVQDLASNGVANPGQTTFTPELIHYDPIVLPDADGENFTNTLNEDVPNSGADWGSGRLAAGWGGGSGRLGALHVPALQTLTLQTDGTVFKNLTAADPATNLPIVATTGILDNSQPTGGPAGYVPTDTLTWPTSTVVDGSFEFSSVVVDNGGILVITGTQHARLFSRGPATINGIIDVRGESSPAQDSSLRFGGPRGDGSGPLASSGGPNAGDGGKGGDRPDSSIDTTGGLIGAGGISNPGAVVIGARGMGVGRSGSLASGKGGVNNPNPFPISTDPTLPGRGGLLYSDISGDGFSPCTSRQVASPGGGGAYGVSGGTAAPATPTPAAFNPANANGLPLIPNTPATNAPGGDAAALGIEPPDPQSGHNVRLLDATRNLRGGSGGGGGGASAYNTTDSDLPGNTGQPCYQSNIGLTVLDNYEDQSAGGGGGGGGAIQVVSGAQIHVGGQILASGGDGGGSVNDPLQERIDRASPGGGGSGGAVRLQAKTVVIDATAGHIDVSGGLGGLNVSPGDSGGNVSLGQGGDGGSGLVRLEDLSAGTSPPATNMTRCSEAPKILPFDPSHIDPNTISGPCVGLPESEMLLSVGAWSPPTKRPETFSAAVSCWMRPIGDFFTLDFLADDLSQSPPIYGWNMQVLYHDPASGNDILTTYRGRDANTPFGSGDFESNFGNLVNYLNEANPPGNQFGTGPINPAATGSYLSVRFQGALAISDISGDPCNVTLSGSGSEIATGSLTPWVRHPAELTQFLPRPNMVRFCIVFDRSMAPAGSIAANVRGVTDLMIHAQPD